MIAIQWEFAPFVTEELLPVLLVSFFVYGCFTLARKFLVKMEKTDMEKCAILDTSSEVSDNEDNPSHVRNGLIEKCKENGHFVQYRLPRRPVDEMVKASKEFYDLMNERRSVRAFSRESVPIEVVQNVIRTAGTSPSGAHTQPWTYAVVSNSELKERIREIIEAEEEINYKKRMSTEWVRDLRKFRTNWSKPYLTDAPYLIAVFKQTHHYDEKNQRREHYYNEISTCISIGLLIAALQNAGLAALTSTPMNAGPAIRELLQRPPNEKLVILLPVGFPARDCMVPALERKPLEEIMIEYH